MIWEPQQVGQQERSAWEACNLGLLSCFPIPSFFVIFGGTVYWKCLHEISAVLL